MARVSEWAVVSEVEDLWLRERTTTSPSITTTAPNVLLAHRGASAFASSIAMAMKMS